jgi:hypothetical protein
MTIKLLFAVYGFVGLSVGVGQEPPGKGECPGYDRVIYSAPRRDWPGSIVVENVPGASRPVPPPSELHHSDQDTASYFVREPDTTKPGPWTTIVEVFGNEARPIHLRIRIADHASGGVRTRWLNEKLLWLQVWRGRIVSTDMILDIETQRFVYEQDANYNSLILPCSTKPGAPK